METVGIKLICGTETFSINLTRVPVVGEKIAVLHQTYIVRDVIHTPGLAQVAEVWASIFDRNRS